MTVFFVLLNMLLLVVNYPSSDACIPCSVNCVCDAMEANCRNLTSLQPGTFPADIKSVMITNSNISKLQSNIFGSHFENIVIEHSDITEITTDTFTNLPVLKSIRFRKVFIGNIKNRSFNNITSKAEIEFSDSKIDRFESGALSHIRNLERINITFTTVSYFDSYAFFDISVREFLFTDTDIESMSTSSFSSIFNVDKFAFDMVTITTIQAGAFNNLRAFKEVSIKNCNLKDIQCNAIMELREATPGSHETFVFANSRLICGCSTVPIVEYLHKFKNAISDSVVCLKNNSNEQEPLKIFNTSTSCLNVVQSCPRSDSGPSTIKTTYTNEQSTKTPTTYLNVNQSSPRFNQSLSTSKATATVNFSTSVTSSNVIISNDGHTYTCANLTRTILLFAMFEALYTVNNYP